MPFISKIKLPNDDTTYDIKSKTTQGILYGEVASTSTASAFTATISDLNIAAYYDGLTIMLKNGVVNAGSTFTLNINSLGAKEVKANSVSANGNSLFANGSTMIFVYSSTAATNGAWYCYHGVDNVSGMYYVAGSGSTASKTSSPYYAARWRGTNNSITSLYTGLCIYYKLDVAGNGSYGTVLSLNGGDEHPVVANVNTMVGTRYAVGCIIQLVYDAAQTANVYLNGTAAVTVTGCWKIADYDSNTVTQTITRDFVVGKNAGALYRYQICLVDENDGLVPYNNVSNAAATYTKATNTTPFDPFRGMYWYGTTTTVNAGAGASIGSNTMYLVYQQDARYSFNLNSGVASSQVAATNGATVYNTSYKYAVGAYCTYLGELYKCKTAITTAGAWNASQWTKISDYSSTSAYAVNAECIHSGYVWKCTAAIGSGGEAWNSAHWTLTTMTGMISSYPVYIKAKYNKTTHLATLVGDTSSTSYLVRSSITHGLPEENPNTGLAANEMYIYIFVGRSYTCYNVGMFAMHPVYYWNEIAGKATIFTGAEEAVVPTKTSDLTNDGDDGTHLFLATDDVAAVATSGSYNDLTNKPTIPTVGTLNTNNTSAQTASSSESFGGTINLHKVAKTGTYSDLVGKPTLGTAAAKDTTNTYSATGTDPITGTGVAAALATLPTPMQFKGTVGFHGTIEWANLPAASASTGYTYKVIENHNAISDSPPICKVGDTIVSNGTDWVVIPSGDEPSGTVTNVATGSGLTGGPITGSGTISHADTSSQATVTNTGNTVIQSVSLDDFGHVTSLSSKSLSIPSAPGTLNTNNDTAQPLPITAEALSGAINLHKIAKTGTYSDLIGKPTIPSAPGTLDTTATTAQSTNASEALSGSVTLHKVSKTGSYNDLLNKPTIPSAPGTLNTTATTAQSTNASEALSGSVTLHKIAKTGSYNDLLNTPSLSTVATSGSYNDLTDKPTFLEKPKKEIFGIPVAEQSGSYVPVPTGSATRYQFATEENIDPSTMQVLAWCTGEDIKSYYQSYDVSFTVLTISNTPSITGIDSYWDCIGAYNDGIYTTLYALMHETWMPLTYIDLANFELNTKLHLILKDANSTQVAYANLEKMPITLTWNMDAQSSFMLTAIMAESTTMTEFPNFTGHVDSDYASKLIQMINTQQGQIHLYSPGYFSMIIPFSTFGGNGTDSGSIVSGSAYVLTAVSGGIDGFLKVAFTKGDSTWKLYVGSFIAGDEYISINATYSNDTWAFDPTMSSVWSAISDPIDHMDVYESKAKNVGLTFQDKHYCLKEWYDAGNTWTEDGVNYKYALVFQHEENNIVSQLLIIGEYATFYNMEVRFTTSKLNGPPQTIYCIPVTTHASDASIIPTAEATVWQFTTPDRVNLQAGIVEWISGEDIENYLKNNTVTFLEINVTANGYSTKYLYSECTEAMRDVNCTLNEFLSLGKFFGDYLEFSRPGRKVKINITNSYGVSPQVAYTDPAYGEITSTSSGTVTNVAISNGGGLSVSGSPISSSGTITISHSDTSSQASVSNSGRTYIQSVTLDTYGHVTGLSSATETVTDTNTTYSLSGALASHKFTSTLTAGGSGSGTSTTDLTLAAGSNITLTDDTSNRKITIAATDTNTTYSLAVNGTGDNENKLGLTAGGSGSGTVWVTVPYATTAGSAPSEFVFTDFTVGA